MRKIIFSIFLLILPLSIFADGIYVNGQAEIIAEPDIAYITISSSFVDEDISIARDKVSTIISNAIADLQKLYQISDNDISTSYIATSERREWSTENKTYENVGYEARQTIDVKIRDLQALGAIYANMMGRTGLTISSPVLDRENKEQLYKEARILAVQHAIEKAQTLADAAGVKIKGVKSITDNSGYQPVYRTSNMKYATNALYDAAPESYAEYYAKDITVNCNISMEFALDDSFMAQSINAIQL